MLIFHLRPSGRLKKVLVFAHLLALCASFANALPLLVQGLVALALAAHYRLAVAGGKFKWQTLRYSEALGWEMANSDRFVAVRILPDTVITIFALFLHIEIQDNDTHINRSNVFNGIKLKDRHTLLILPDSLGRDGYRGLVVKLRTTYKIKSKSADLLVKSV